MTTISKTGKSIVLGVASALAMLASPLLQAHNDCTPYTAVLNLEGPSPFGPLSGVGIYNIGDLPPQPAQVTAVLKGSASFDPTNPVIEVAFADMVLFPPAADGSLNVLTAIDRSIGQATGPGTFQASTRSRITGGSGIYEDVTGRARSTNQTSVDLSTGYTTSVIDVKGRLCGLGGDD